MNSDLTEVVDIANLNKHGYILAWVLSLLKGCGGVNNRRRLFPVQFLTDPYAKKDK
jgi:hypothetical protein